MNIFLYFVAIVWIGFGIAIFLGAWGESATDYEEHVGTLSDDPQYTRDSQYDTWQKKEELPIVKVTFRLEGKKTEYRLRGQLYRPNADAISALRKGDEVKLMVKKTALVGGVKRSDNSKWWDVSAISHPSGEVILSLEKGIAHAKKRLVIAAAFILLGLLLAYWTYSRG